MATNQFANVYFKWSILGEIFYNGKTIDGILIIEPLQLVSLDYLMLEIELEVRGRMIPYSQQYGKASLVTENTNWQVGENQKLPFSFPCPTTPSYSGKNLQLLWSLKVLCRLNDAFKSDMRKRYFKKLMLGRAFRPEGEFEIIEHLGIEPNPEKPFSADPIRFYLHRKGLLNKRFGLGRLGRISVFHGKLSAAGAEVQISLEKNWHRVTQIEVLYELYEEVIDRHPTNPKTYTTNVYQVSVGKLLSPQQENTLQLAALPANLPPGMGLTDARLFWQVTLLFYFDKGGRKRMTKRIIMYK